MPPLSPAITRTRQPAALGLRLAIVGAAIVAMAVLVGLSLTASHSGQLNDRLETTDQLFQQLTIAREDHAKALVDLESARAVAAEAKSRQQSFLTAQLTQPPVVAPALIPPVETPPPASPVMITNPTWADLTVQLNELNSVRRGLLERYTVEHPEVRYLDVQISDLERSRSAVPELIAAPEVPPNAAPQPTAEQVASAEKTRREQMRVTALQEFAELQRKSDLAQQKLHAAESAESRAMERVASLAARLSAISAPQPPAPVRPATVWASIALVAVLVVLASATLALGRTRVGPTFNTPLEVEQELRLPVVGVISMPAVQAIEVPFEEPEEVNEEQVFV